MGSTGIDEDMLRLREPSKSYILTFLHVEITSNQEHIEITPARDPKQCGGWKARYQIQAPAAMEQKQMRF